VAQDEDLHVLGGIAAGEECEQGDRATQREVDEFRQHAGGPPGGFGRRHATEHVVRCEVAGHRPRSSLRTLQAHHERMAAWYAEHGDQADAEMERHMAAVQQQQLLADLDAAFEALEAAVCAALEPDR